MRKLLAVFLLAAFAALPPLTALAGPITMDWSLVGNPGNAADPATGSLYGAVGYSYNIGTYDVTVNQYVAFLNSNDPTGADPLGLYNSAMGNPAAPFFGEISYNSGGSDGSLYSAMPGDGNLPIVYVTLYDTLRFANWLNNGQAPGSTETGAYTLLGGTPTPSNFDSITRNADATAFLASENEWYKAAYYNPATSSYYADPTSSNTTPTASGPTAAPNSANYNEVVNYPGNGLTNVGAYSGTTSPYGAYDMGGDVFQWNEAVISGTFYSVRGGAYDSDSASMLSSTRGNSNAFDPGSDLGFRVASVVPEPSTGVLAVIACGVMAWWRKRFK